MDCQGEENNHYEIHSETFLQQRPTLQKKTTRAFPSWGKEISPTPATSKISVSHKGEKISQQGSGVQENRLGTLQSRKGRRCRENAKPLEKHM